jgi:aconitate hydratase
VPRSLPTDDVLLLRKGKGKSKGEVESTKSPVAMPVNREGWKAAGTLVLVVEGAQPAEPSAMLLQSLDSVRWVARNAAALGPNLCAVIAEHIPSGLVPLFAGLGIVTLGTDAASLKKLASEATITLPAPDPVDGEPSLSVIAGNGTRVELEWLAVGAERKWTLAGTARAAMPAPAKARPAEQK